MKIEIELDMAKLTHKLYSTTLSAAIGKLFAKKKQKQKSTVIGPFIPR